MTQPKLEVGKKYIFPDLHPGKIFQLTSEDMNSYHFQNVKCDLEVGEVLGQTVHKHSLQHFEIKEYIEEPMKEEVKRIPEIGKKYNLHFKRPPTSFSSSNPYKLLMIDNGDLIFRDRHNEIIIIYENLLENITITEHRELINKTAQGWLLYDPETDPTMGFLDQLFGVNVEDIWPQKQGGEAKDFAEQQGFMCKKVELIGRELPEHE